MAVRAVKKVAAKKVAAKRAPAAKKHPLADLTEEQAQHIINTTLEYPDGCDDQKYKYLASLGLTGNIACTAYITIDLVVPVDITETNSYMGSLELNNEGESRIEQLLEGMDWPEGVEIDLDGPGGGLSFGGARVELPG